MDLESLLAAVGNFAPPVFLVLMGVGYALATLRTGGIAETKMETFREYLANGEDDEELDNEVPAFMVR